MLGHTLSQHLNLVFVFPLPLVALFCVRYFRGKTSARRFVVVLALLLLVELGSSFELFVDLTLLLALGLAFAIAAGSGQRGRYLRLAGFVSAAYVVLLPLLVPIAVFALAGPHGAVPYAPAAFATDAANLVVPTPTVLAGMFPGARAISLHFVSNVGEQDGYLGIPLIILALVTLVRQWRRGAWLVGALLLCTLLLSFGPTLSVAGHPLLALPFALAHLPVVSYALPARLSIFSALCASVLAALWFSRARRRWLKLSVATVLAASLLPNFWPPSQLAGRLGVSSHFGYGTHPVPTGFVADPLWRRLIAPGSTVLVLPTGNRTAASWWQVQSGMRFALAVPATLFPPPAVAAQPVVQGLVANDVQALDGTTLAAARLRAFLLADHVAAVLVTPDAGLEWEDIVGRATAAQPLLLGDTLLYRVGADLTPLVSSGDLHVLRRGGSVLEAWLAFDGQHARVRVYYRARHARKGRTVTLSSPASDAYGLAVDLGSRGQPAVAFTEYRDGQVSQLVATHAKRWRTVTLETRSQAISSTAVAVVRDGTAVVTWIDAADPLSILRAASLTQGGRLERVGHSGQCPSGRERRPARAGHGCSRGLQRCRGRKPEPPAPCHLQLRALEPARHARYELPASGSCVDPDRPAHSALDTAAGRQP